MTIKIKSVLVFVVVFISAFYSNSFADCESVLSRNVGWTILDSKTIEGYYDSEEGKKDGFEGCDHGRIIYFMDGTRTQCNSYGYQYAYMPTAIILGKNFEYQGKNFTMYKMIVEGEEYDVQ